MWWYGAVTKCHGDFSQPRGQPFSSYIFSQNPITRLNRGAVQPWPAVEAGTPLDKRTISSIRVQAIRPFQFLVRGLLRGWHPHASILGQAGLITRCKARNYLMERYE